MEMLKEKEEIDLKSFAESLMKYHNQFRKPFPISRFKNFSLEKIFSIIRESIETNTEYHIPLVTVEKEKKIYNKKINYLKLINTIRSNMSEIGFDYNFLIKEYNDYVKLRKQGHVFAFNEHLKAIIMVQLYNDRWGDEMIKNNIDRIRVIFKDFDKDELKKASKEEIFDKLSAIECTNSATKKILNGLNYNIEMLEKIEKDYGSLDDFVESNDPLVLAENLYEGKYKLKQIGIFSALEYFKRVGIETTRPSRGLSRIISKERLNLISDSNGTRNEILNLLKIIEKETKIPKEEINLLLWQFSSKTCAGICSTIPRCNLCKLKNICNYNKNGK